MSFTLTLESSAWPVASLLAAQFVALNVLIRGGSGRGSFFLYFFLSSMIGVAAYYLSLTVVG